MACPAAHSVWLASRPDQPLVCRSLTPTRSALKTAGSGLLQRGGSKVVAVDEPPPVPLDSLGRTASGLMVVQPGSRQGQVSVPCCQAVLYL